MEIWVEFKKDQIVVWQVGSGQKSCSEEKLSVASDWQARKEKVVKEIYFSRSNVLKSIKVIFIRL